MSHAKDAAPPNDRQPTFLARKIRMSRQYYVRIAWSNTRVEAVGRFCGKAEAISWINEASAAWIEQHRAAAARIPTATQTKRSRKRRDITACA